jgi:hypothetical protein
MLYCLLAEIVQTLATKEMGPIMPSNTVEVVGFNAAE